MWQDLAPVVRDVLETAAGNPALRLKVDRVPGRKVVGHYPPQARPKHVARSVERLAQGITNWGAPCLMNVSKARGMLTRRPHVTRSKASEAHSCRKSEGRRCVPSGRTLGARG